METEHKSIDGLTQKKIHNKLSPQALKQHTMKINYEVYAAEKIPICWSLLVE